MFMNILQWRAISSEIFSHIPRIINQNWFHENWFYFNFSVLYTGLQGHGITAGGSGCRDCPSGPCHRFFLSHTRLSAPLAPSTNLASSPPSTPSSFSVTPFPVLRSQLGISNPCTPANPIFESTSAIVRPPATSQCVIERESRACASVRPSLQTPCNHFVFTPHAMQPPLSRSSSLPSLRLLSDCCCQVAIAQEGDTCARNSITIVFLQFSLFYSTRAYHMSPSKCSRQRQRARSRPHSSRRYPSDPPQHYSFFSVVSPPSISGLFSATASLATFRYAMCYLPSLYIRRSSVRFTVPAAVSKRSYSTSVVKCVTLQIQEIVGKAAWDVRNTNHLSIPSSQLPQILSRKLLTRTLMFKIENFINILAPFFLTCIPWENKKTTGLGSETVTRCRQSFHRRKHKTRTMAVQCQLLPLLVFC